jgi:GNAT superfamily N-acetyltransferase
MDYIVRLANPDDAPALYGISLRAHTASYYDTLVPQGFLAEFNQYYQWSDERQETATAVMVRKINHPAWRVAVAESEGKIIGYTLAHLKDEGKLMLRGLFVDPSSHSKGVGTALFELSLSWARPGDIAELVVIEENIVARRLYESHGFKIVGTKAEDFFGAKQVIMQAKLD